MKKTGILSGERFGSLVTLEMTHKKSRSGRKRAHWLCRCDCGNTSEVDSGNLRNGNSRQCHQCAVVARGKARTTHGQASGYTTTKAYRAWQSMKQRVFDPKVKSYKDYGGRGIDMDPRWKASFESFLDDIGYPPTHEHQIDRIDNSKGYWPGNCRWATLSEQASNKRNNILIEHRGEIRTLPEWCSRLGLNYDKVKRRYYLNGNKPEIIFSKKELPKGPASYVYYVDGKAFKSLSAISGKEGLSMSAVYSRFNSDAFPAWTKHKA